MSGGRTHIFSFDMATPSRRNSSHRTRVTASDQELVNSLIGDSEDASPRTPRVAIRTPSASHRLSPDANHNEIPGNLPEPGYVIWMSVIVQYLLYDRDSSVTSAVRQLREQQKKLQASSSRIEKLLQQLNDKCGESTQSLVTRQSIPRELSVSSQFCNSNKIHSTRLEDCP